MAQREHRDVPEELVPPPGLADATPLLGRAEPPPSPPHRAAPLAPAEPLTRELFLEPPARYRPWTRWWWLGGLVDEAEIQREVALFAEKGFGGVEIQAFSLGDRVDRRPGMRERVLSFDSDQLWSNLRAALDAARRSGIGVDLNHGSGWPAGGPWVGLADTYETLVYGEASVDGGRDIAIALPEPRVPLGFELTLLLERVFGSEVISFPVEHRRLVAVVAAREVGTSSRPAPVTLDPSTLRVLDAEQIENGRLVWRAPAGGTWRVIAIYAMPGGEAPTLVAAARPGLVLDHFDAAKVKAHYDYLFGARTGIDRYWGDPLRGFFNDSLEFKTERHWAGGFLEEFARRRGYDLRPWLPALFVAGADNFFVSDVFGVHPEPDFSVGEDGERVRWDYELTVSELVTERFFDASREWASARGLLSRAQGYGMALDAIGAAGHIDIPETEALYGGGSDLFLKLASSGAHLYGRPLVSAESFVWRGAEYRTSPQKVRAAADKLFCAGVNHLVWHGTPYRVTRGEGDGFGEEGWYPWSIPGATLGFSTNFSEASPFWTDAADLNRYLARAQMLLRQGRPEADVLVYYPFLRFPSSFGGDETVAAREDLFNGSLLEVEPVVPSSSMSALLGDRAQSREDPLVPWLRAQQELLQTIEEAGLTWEWTNAEALEAARWRGGGVEIGDGRYGAILLAAAPWLPVETAEAVARLAEDGAPVVLAGEPPSRQPGFHQRETGDAKVRDAIARVIAARRRNERGDIGARAVASEVRESVKPATLVERRASSPAIRHLGRALGDDRSAGAVVLVRNASAAPASAELRLPRTPGSVVLLDAVSGAIRKATTTSDGWIQIALGARDSIFVVAGVALDPTPEPGWPARWLVYDDSVVAPLVLENWEITVEGPDVGGGRFERTGPLFDWRDEPGLRLVSSPGRYRSSFNLPDHDPKVRYVLDLGRVAHVADLVVNGQPVPGTLLYSPFVADITSSLAAGRNTIEVTVRSPLLNRFIGLGDRGDVRYQRFSGRPPLAAGLLGPVVLHRVGRAVP